MGKGAQKYIFFIWRNIWTFFFFFWNPRLNSSFSSEFQNLFEFLFAQIRYYKLYKYIHPHPHIQYIMLQYIFFYSVTFKSGSKSVGVKGGSWSNYPLSYTSSAQPAHEFLIQEATTIIVPLLFFSMHTILSILVFVHYYGRRFIGKTSIVH